MGFVISLMTYDRIAIPCSVVSHRHVLRKILIIRITEIIMEHLGSFKKSHPCEQSDQPLLDCIDAY